MLLTENLQVNRDGHLEIGGCDAVALAKQYGTPLYVMDEGLVKKHCKIYTDAVDKHYDGNGLILYASKAFCSVAMLRIIAEMGLGIDVVSGGELYTAMRAKFPCERIYFHGNNKTLAELTLALEYRVGRIVVDNITELLLLNRLAAEQGVVQEILFRIKPGIDAHTHDFVRTGQIDSKFRVALETGEAFEAVKAAQGLSNVSVVGIHCHIGSQIFDTAPFEEAAKVMVDFAADIKDKLSLTISELNLGGGFGIKYIQGDDPMGVEDTIARVAETVKRIAALRGLPLPRIMMEPGRSIAGPSGITLYTVGAVKDIPGIRTYVSVDGGMTDNPRFILYRSVYEALVANRAAEPKSEKVTLAGKCCESGDLIGENMMLQPLAPGDIVAVLATGAYNYSMANNYNRNPRPAVVMVENGKARMTVRRETYDDIVRLDVVE